MKEVTNDCICNCSDNSCRSDARRACDGVCKRFREKRENFLDEFTLAEDLTDEEIETLIASAFEELNAYGITEEQIREYIEQKKN